MVQALERGERLRLSNEHNVRRSHKNIALATLPALAISSENSLSVTNIETSAYEK